MFLPANAPGSPAQVSIPPDSPKGDIVAIVICICNTKDRSGFTSSAELRHLTFQHGDGFAIESGRLLIKPSLAQPDRSQTCKHFSIACACRGKLFANTCGLREVLLCFGKISCFQVCRRKLRQRFRNAGAFRARIALDGKGLFQVLRGFGQVVMLKASRPSSSRCAGYAYVAQGRAFSSSPTQAQGVARLH